ncbi:type II secretion system protein E [Acidilobus saccharovorans 345-15]|uniref:Type II secretion system protein E n=1 Tax=Acidilobus saccharovorans (strain DSM 16705 / JCM 18335 / VKM B-2471 / 345-15) TaxID=666510 RepID=D9Q068_ACIS3|nr:type II/IV secretion system ATPase subunit [Acidilobus saccharovorans]ADL18706.1 type II secretion system protein E [Acidilobus saccharovorans 345-15]
MPEKAALEGVKLLEKYAVIGMPKVEVSIYEDTEGRRYYEVAEPPLNTEVRRKAYSELLSVISRNLTLLEALNASGSVEKAFNILRPYAYEVVKSIVRGQLKARGSLDEAVTAVTYHVARDLVGYGPIEPLMRDPYIEDISCNGIGIPVFVYHTRYEWLTTNVVMQSAQELNSLVAKLGVRSGKEPSIATPIVEGVLKREGYRVNIVLDVVSRHGSQFTIRKFRAEPFTIVELLRLKTLDPLVAALLWIAVSSKQGVVFYGPTGSGKTTLLNAVTMLVPTEYKIVTVEDTPEVFLPFHENWGGMVSRPSTDPRVENVTLQSQVEAALRQRPDVIIVGEIRSREAYAFFQALATGHGGLTTVHAESADVLVKRLTSPPMNVPASLVSTAKVFVNILRVERGGQVSRRVTRVHESRGYDPSTDSIRLGEIVVWDPEKDVWRLTKERIDLLSTVAELRLITYDEAYEDVIRRATVLEWLAEKNADVTLLHTITRLYERDPENVYKTALKEVKRFEPPA